MDIKANKISIEVPERSLLRKKSDFRKIKFSDLIAKSEKAIEEIKAAEAEKVQGIENEKFMIKLFNSDNTDELLDDFILNDNRQIYEDLNKFGKTQYVSMETHREFYTKYKNFSDITRKGVLKTMTPSFAFIKACNNQMLVPNPIGILKRKGNENQINLKNNQLGDEYVTALSHSLKFSDHINELNLSANRLTFYGVNPLINSIRENKKLIKRLKVLDLSNNRIGENSIKNLIKYIQEEDCELKELNLEGNSLGDKLIKDLCEIISKCLSDKLIYLNLAKNSISDELGINLANIIQNCINMQIMIISWNHIKNKGATLIFKQLRKHNEMKVFDISWNTIGDNLCSDPCIEEIKLGSHAEREKFHNFELNEFKKSKNLVFKNYAPEKKNQKAGGGKENNKKQEVKGTTI